MLAAHVASMCPACTSSRASTSPCASARTAQRALLIPSQRARQGRLTRSCCPGEVNCWSVTSLGQGRNGTAWCLMAAHRGLLFVFTGNLSMLPSLRFLQPCRWDIHGQAAAHFAAGLGAAATNAAGAAPCGPCHGPGRFATRRFRPGRHAAGVEAELRQGCRHTSGSLGLANLLLLMAVAGAWRGKLAARCCCHWCQHAALPGDPQHPGCTAHPAGSSFEASGRVQALPKDPQPPLLSKGEQAGRRQVHAACLAHLQPVRAGRAWVTVPLPSSSTCDSCLAASLLAARCPALLQLTSLW